MTTVTLTRPGASQPLLIAEGMIPASSLATLIILGDINDGGLKVNLLVDSDQKEQTPMVEFQMVSGVEAGQDLVEEFRLMYGKGGEEVRARYVLAEPAVPTFRLYNVQGQLQHEESAGVRGRGVHHYSLNPGQLEQGWYMLVMSNEEGEVMAREQIIINR